MSILYLLRAAGLASCCATLAEAREYRSGARLPRSSPRPHPPPSPAAGQPPPLNRPSARLGEGYMLLPAVRVHRRPVGRLSPLRTSSAALAPVAFVHRRCRRGATPAPGRLRPALAAVERPRCLWWPRVRPVASLLAAARPPCRAITSYPLPPACNSYHPQRG